MKARSHLRSFGRRLAPIALVVILAAGGSTLEAQGRRGRNRDPSSYLDDMSNQAMTWTVKPAFKEDVFTFARLRHRFGGGYGYGFRESWAEDYPLADEMLAYRLHQITSLEVRPPSTTIDMTEEEMMHYPFVYLAGVERISLGDTEVTVLRRYMQNGGFLMVDNFWGDAAWTNFAREMKRVFPEVTPIELGIEHPIFHCVYNFSKKPQMPTAGVFSRFGLFYDPNRDYDVMTNAPHYFALIDKKGRMMMLICHNNHFGDGWEHEGDDPVYFHTISEGMAYPMFINIIVYAMGH